MLCAQREPFTLVATFTAWPMVMAMTAIYRTIVSSRGPVPDRCFSTLRFLLNSLDMVEDLDGYWHEKTADIRSDRRNLEEMHGISEFGFYP